MSIKKSKRLRVVRINRAKWLTGEVIDMSNVIKSLPEVSGLREKGWQCCLGFVCAAAGVAPRLMVGHAAPKDIIEDHPSLKDRLVEAGLVTQFRNYILCPGGLANPLAVKDAMNINDTANIDRKTREKKVILALRRAGWRVVFHGFYDPRLDRDR